jgi:hypothetical protein
MAKKWYPDCEYALVLIDFGGSQLEKNKNQLNLLFPTTNCN